MDDPTILLNHHVALLALVELAKEEVVKYNGVKLLAMRFTGKMLMAELERSRERLRANKIWVADRPIGERRYRYSLAGRRGEHEISQDDLDMHMRAIEGDMVRVIDKMRPG
ncbi:hypothetical protein ACF3MZ_21210 [Paenibacillaceae bacterium WGS1546]|uniref:hypothetical protein n=1 Tax=Cohnella sp. WGS1546 TaxID=3366810 RepID=UPI00372D5964